ncbi:hypothetical protein BSKO_08987 [Bryopsis sp. KO-2023]|nr:hypothetical protein BSKO_08987 [Bryopsis sp. KO-2023]
MILDQPKYPVLDSAPGVWKTVSYFRGTDYCWWGGLTAASLPFGFISGTPVGLQRPSMFTAGLLGGIAGFLFAYQNASGRLMGLNENSLEVQGAEEKK